MRLIFVLLYRNPLDMKPPPNNQEPKKYYREKLLEGLSPLRLVALIYSPRER